MRAISASITTPAIRTAAVPIFTFIAAALLMASAVQAQPAVPSGMSRTETMRHDLDSKTEATQVRIDFAHGASGPKHTHPGVEIAYVLSGTLEYELEGKTVRLRAGEALFIPAGAVHSARNVGAGTSTELATYLLEKNKPVVELVK